MEIVVTTERKPKASVVADAKRLSRLFNAPYVPRRHRSIEDIKGEFGKNVLVVKGDLNLTVYTLSGKRLFFHPGLFKIRLLNYLRTEHEAMVDAMNLKEGDSVLDCNLGLAQDALLSAFVSRRRVVGVEKDPVIAEMVRRGLKTYKPRGKLEVASFAFNLIDVNVSDNFDFLKRQEDRSFDVVYFSPMFIKPKWHCDVMAPMREVAVKDFLTRSVIDEAERVARKRVVIKVNRGVHELFDFLKSYSVQKSSTNVEYLYREL